MRHFSPDTRFHGLVNGPNCVTIIVVDWKVSAAGGFNPPPPQKWQLRCCVVCEGESHLSGVIYKHYCKLFQGHVAFKLRLVAFLGSLWGTLLYTAQTQSASSFDASFGPVHIYFGYHVIFLPVLFCVLFFLTFCSVLFCVICVNAVGFSITLSCECAYVIRSPPTQKSVPLSQRAGWEPEYGASHCFQFVLHALSSLSYSVHFLICKSVASLCPHSSTAVS